MKTLDYSPIPFDGGKLSFQDRLKGIFQFGFAWVSEMKSQETLIGVLGRVLDKRFVLLRNFPLPDGGVTIPLVLMGPHGVTVINNSPLRGLYRAKGKSWEVMDNRMKNFKSSKPNYTQRTKLMSRAFGEFLTQSGFALETDEVLIFTDPGIHINTMQPDIRIILMDAMERFGAQLVQVNPVMTVEDIRIIISSLETAIKPKEEVKEDNRVMHLQVAESVDSKFMQTMEPLQKILNFSLRQWILLGLIVAANVLVLIGILFYILIMA